MTPFFASKKNLVVLGIVAAVLLIIGFITLSNNKSMSENVAKAGDHVFVNYTGTLENGTKFDSSYDRGAPFDFIVGVGQVIKGWDEGIVGMKVGEKKHLVIPPEKGYGAQQITDATGAVIIPANATLVFDVELVSIDN